MKKSLPMVIRNKRPKRTSFSCALQAFGLSQKIISQIGLTKAKSIAKKRYRKLLFMLHPDTAVDKNVRINVANNKYISVEKLQSFLKRIEKQKFMPIDIDNVNQILNLSKEYKTTDEVDYGLNGPV